MTENLRAETERVLSAVSPATRRTLEESAAETGGWQDTLLNFVSTNIFEAMASATMVPIIVFSLDEPGGFRGILSGTGTYTRVHG